MGEMDKRSLGIDEILRWHYNTRPVSEAMIVDLEVIVTPEKDQPPLNQQSTGTTTESDTFGSDQYNDGDVGCYDTILESSWVTPAKTRDAPVEPITYTPHQQLPGLRAEELDLWGSGVKTSQSSEMSEEAQLLARLAVL